MVEVASWSATRAEAVPYGLLIASVVPLVLYLVVRVSVSWELIDCLLPCITVFATVAAFTVLYEYFVAGHVVFANAADPTLSQFNAGSGRLFRPGGVFGGAPTASIVLSMTLLASLPLVLKARGRSRLIYAGALLVMLLAVVLTLSRAGWTGLAAGLLAFMWLFPWRVEWWTRLLALTALLATIVIWAVPPATTQSTFFREGIVRSQNTSGRENLWSRTPDLVADSESHLFFGHGFDAFFGTGSMDAHLAENALIVEGGGPHNDYLRALIEEGLLGLVLLLGWTVGSVLLGVRRLRRLPARTPERNTLAALTAAVVCLLVSSLTHDTTHSIPVVMAAAIVTGVLITLAKSCPVAGSSSRSVPSVSEAADPEA